MGTLLLLLVCVLLNEASGSTVWNETGYTKPMENDAGTETKFNYYKYNTLDAINNELYRLQRENPSMVKIIDIGRTYENRPMNVIKLSGNREPGKKTVSMWIDAGIHAREWISISTAMLFIRQLYYGYRTDQIRYLMENVDFYILPVVNPDGYEYTHTTDRLWRKNRSPEHCMYKNTTWTCCKGVDLNRNFGEAWMGESSSRDPCSPVYAGWFPFYEPETWALSNFLSSNIPEAVISLHACGQFILPSYAYKNNTYAANYADELRLAQIGAIALESWFGTKYTVGTSADVFYPVGGSETDWIKSELKVPYVYTMELRDACTSVDFMGNASTVFHLDEQNILYTGLETFEMVKVVAAEIVRRFT